MLIVTNNFYDEKMKKNMASLTPTERKAVQYKDPSLMILNFNNIGDLFFEKKISLASHIEDHSMDAYNIQVCSLDEMVVVYAKQPNPALFALSNQYLKKSFVSLPIDDPNKIEEMHCPGLRNSRLMKKSYF
jgi:hypothetical protein